MLLLTSPLGWHLTSELSSTSTERESLLLPLAPLEKQTENHDAECQSWFPHQRNSGHLEAEGTREGEELYKTKQSGRPEDGPCRGSALSAAPPRPQFPQGSGPPPAAPIGLFASGEGRWRPCLTARDPHTLTATRAGCGRSPGSIRNTQPTEAGDEGAKATASTSPRFARSSRAPPEATVGPRSRGQTLPRARAGFPTFPGVRTGPSGRH